MSSILHALHTGTLAAWLCAAGFGTVGLLVPEWVGRPVLGGTKETSVEWIEPEVVLDPALVPEPGDAPPSPEQPPPEPEPIPSPPVMPEIQESAPLPEIPELPPEPPAGRSAAPVSPPRQTARSIKGTTDSRPAPGGSARESSRNTPAGAGAGRASDATRIAAGRMPAPAYPAEAKRKGQTGRVLVEFTVDSSGRVVAVHASSPSQWPLLNDAAIRAVRRWRFPPGGIMTLQRPIDFELH